MFQQPHSNEGEEMYLPNISKNEITLFFYRYDLDRDGRLRFSEFTEALMPFENPQACEMLERRNANPPGYPLSLRTKEMYKHLWMLIM